MKELAERLRKVLKDDYGIETDEELMEAVRQINLDLGVFVTPIDRRKEQCKEAC